MASPKDTIARVQKAKQAGFDDQQIYSTLAADKDFAQRIATAKKQGFSDEKIASQFGLVIQAVNNASNRRNYQPFDNTKSARQQREKEQLKKQGPTQIWESGLLAFADIGAPFVQATSWAADGISSGLNKVLGTNLRTDSYEGVTKGLKTASDNHNTVRRANDQGSDVVRIGGNMLLTAPLAVAGGTLKAGQALSSAAGREFLTKNASLGALMGVTGIHENNTERLQSMAGGALGGAIGAGVGHKVGQAAGKVVEKGKKVVANHSPQQAAQVLRQIDQKLDDLLKPHGVKLSDLSDEVAQGLRRDAKKALDAGYDLNPKAVERKAVLDSLGIKGTKAQITGNAQQWQKEAELAKVDGAGDALRNKFIGDNQQLNDLLEQSIKNTNGNAVDAYGAGLTARDALQSFNDSARSNIRNLYDTARNSTGNDIVINGQGFANDAITALDNAYAASSLPGGVHKLIKDIDANPNMFTLGKSEELIKILNREYQASLRNGQKTSATHAIGIVRDQLNQRVDEALEGLVANGGNDAAAAYTAARQAFKQHAETVERIPFLKDVIKGVEPDKLFQKHILNGEIGPLKETVKILADNNPQAVYNLKQQVLQHIANKAINQNGQFSPAGMDKALKALTDRKLAVLFSPKELQHIKDIGRAGHYLVTQPAHSYVNNSNTASGLMNYFGDVLKGLDGFALAMPYLNKGRDILVKPVQSAAAHRASRQALRGGSITGEALPATTQQQNLIDALTKAGLLGGANLPE